MKKTFCCIAASLLAIASFAGKKAQPAPKYAGQAVELTNMVDSINYALGLANGVSIKEQMFQAIDSAENDLAIAAFMDALSQGFENGPVEESQLVSAAKNVGVSIKEMETTGVAGLKQWVINEKMLFAGMQAIFLKQTPLMDSDSAMAYFQREYDGYKEDDLKKAPKNVVIDFPAKPLKVKLKTQNDSLNYAFGLINAKQIQTYILADDSMGKATEEFIQTLRLAIKNPQRYPRLTTMGQQIGGQINQQSITGLIGIAGLETRFELIKKGFINGLYDQLDFGFDEANIYLQTTINELQFGAAKAEGAAFLKAMSAVPGNITTPSGLVYKVITPGTGATPALSDMVRVHYEGKLINGTIFDSSYRRGDPITFGVTQVIKGWTEMLQLMQVGEVVEVYIPYNLAYGERGAGGQIPPYATLIFKIELLGIE